jgi:DNA-directed RNA polymerase subunit beta'
VPLTKKALGTLIDATYRLRPEGDRAPRRPHAHDRVHQRDERRHLDLHRRHAHPAGEVPSWSTSAARDVAEIEKQYVEGLITDGERYNKVIDIWAKVGEQVAKVMMKASRARS